MIIIASQGEIEANAMILHGASTKREDSQVVGDGSKIGFFGSGNKLALAVFLRHGLVPLIYSGERRLSIETRATQFRGREFKQIFIDGRETSITTDASPEWGLRDAMREVVSNAMDEGSWEFYQGMPRPTPGKTLYCIPETPELLHIFNNHWMLMAPNSSLGNVIPLSLTGSVAQLYRKGIIVDALQNISNRLAHFSYNLQDVKINESRKVSVYDALKAIGYLLRDCTHDQVFEAVLSGNCLERTALGWVGYELEGSAWARFLRKKFDFYYEVGQEQNIKPEHFSRGVRIWDQDSIAISKLLPVYKEWLRDNTSDMISELDPYMKGRVQQLIEELAPINLRSFPILYDSDPFPHVLGYVKDGSNYIYITSTGFAQSDKELQKTLLEELIHLNFCVGDFTRSFQEACLELIIKTIKKDQQP